MQRNVTAPRPNQLWVSEPPYEPTWRGFVYVAFITDAFSRRIVCWRATTSLRTDLALDALEQAVYDRETDGALVHHNARGSQYPAIRYTDRLLEAGIESSVGRRRVQLHHGGRPMWIFTKHGFFSAVCARQGSGKHGQPVDPDRIMVRSRVRAHLEALKNRFPGLLGQCEVLESSESDYAFRLFVVKSSWSQVMSGLAEETDYDNFKSEVARHQGKAGSRYEHALHDVWSVMHALQ